MSELVKLQEQLYKVEEMMAVLVDLSDERLPIIKNEIVAIVKEIEGGFDRQELSKQMRSVLNEIINQSDYTKVRASIDNTAKTMIDAVQTASNHVDHWQKNYKDRISWSYAIITGAICLCIGFAGAFFWLKPSQDAFDKTINRTGQISEYILHQCKNIK